MKKGIVGMLAVAGLAAAASAQSGGYVVQVEYEAGSGGVVSPTHPTATVRILGEFANAHAFAGGDGDLVAGDGSWSGLTLLDVGDPLGPPPPGTSAGTAVGSTVELFVFGQIFFPPVINPSLANPIPLWEGTWTTNDFTARGVSVETANVARFSLYDATGKSIPITATMGGDRINVVPTPSSLALLGLGGLVALRRRR
jgi:hypothetical protein